MRWISVALFLLISVEANAGSKEKPQAKKTPTPLQEYIESARVRGGAEAPAAGSLYTASARFGDLARDLRASQIDDIVTVIVSDRASAVSRGATNSGRSSSARASVTAAAGPLRAAGPLTDLFGVNSDQKLKGQGETLRESELTTSLSARVVEVLPNGNLVLEGAKDVQVNSERQKVIVRGVVRWNDINNLNQIRSERLAQLEVWIDGKGVVNDSIRRPNILYRILLGVLPF